MSTVVATIRAALRGRRARAAGAVALLLLCSFGVHAADVSRSTVRSVRLAREIAYSIRLPEPSSSPRDASPLVIYLLHGAGGDESSWMGRGALDAALTEALRGGSLPQAVVVMPSLGPDSWWVDGSAQPAASVLVEELIPQIEASLPFAVPRARRALAGVSMGGFGALHLALKHPALFCAAALISPAIYDPLPPPDSAARGSAQFWSSGRFDETLWSGANYPPLLPRYRQGPDRVAFWIVSGDHDHLGIALAAATLFERLRAVQPDQVALRIIGGGHDGPTFGAALPQALAYLDQRCR